MKKTILLLFALISFCAFSQEVENDTIERVIEAELGDIPINEILLASQNSNNVYTVKTESKQHLTPKSWYLVSKKTIKRDRVIIEGKKVRKTFGAQKLYESEHKVTSLLFYVAMLFLVITGFLGLLGDNHSIYTFWESMKNAILWVLGFGLSVGLFCYLSMDFTSGIHAFFIASYVGGLAHLVNMTFRHDNITFLPWLVLGGISMALMIAEMEMLFTAFSISFFIMIAYIGIAAWLNEES